MSSFRCLSVFIFIASCAAAMEYDHLRYNQQSGGMQFGRYEDYVKSHKQALSNFKDKFASAGKEGEGQYYNQQQGQPRGQYQGRDQGRPRASYQGESIGRYQVHRPQGQVQYQGPPQGNYQGQPHRQYPGHGHNQGQARGQYQQANFIGQRRDNYGGQFGPGPHESDTITEQESAGMPNSPESHNDAMTGFSGYYF